MLPPYQLQRSALYMDSPSLADRFSIRVKTRLYVRPLCGDAISWPSMYAISEASGESLALETGLSVNVRFGSLAVVQTDSNAMTALGCKADARPGRMSALTNTGRSVRKNLPITNGGLRPGADLCD